MTVKRTVLLVYWPPSIPGIKERAHRIRLFKNSVIINDGSQLRDDPLQFDLVEFMPGFPQDQIERIKALYDKFGIKQRFSQITDLNADPFNGGSNGKQGNGTQGKVQAAAQGQEADGSTEEDTEEAERPAPVIPPDWEKMPWFGLSALAKDISGKSGNMTRGEVMEVIGNEVKRRKAIGIM